MLNKIKQPTLYILVGNIGSGKSTLVKKYQKKGYIVIYRDGIRYCLGGGNYVFNLDYEPLVHKITDNIFKYFISRKVNMIVDEVNVRKKDRKKYIKFGKKYGYKVICLHMPILTKKESIKRRLQNDHGNQGKRIWNKVWDKFDSGYQCPSLSEGFDKIVKIGD